MSKQHVLLELKQFIGAVASYRRVQKKLTIQALHLLDDLPAAREIVFEYFTLVAEVAVQSYVANTNIDPQTGLPLRKGKNAAPIPAYVEDNCFAAVQESLENLVCKGPAAWRLVIVSWSLEVVGRLSDKYATKRKMSIGAACNFWLNCSAMRGLLTLISISFRKLNNSEAEACVEKLLAAFQRYNLSFDWVVARLGGCFPQKIISQILYCSLKRFAEDISSRFDSEISILEYLSFAHTQELKLVLRDMLQEGFQPKKTLDATIVPFLLVITNFSDQLLQHLVNVFLDMYNDDLRQTIIQKSPLWMSNKHFADMQPSLNNVALRLKKNSASLLIDVASMCEHYSWAQDFLEYTMVELEQIVLNARICPLMDDLATEETKYMLWKSCHSSNSYVQQTAVRLLLIVSIEHSHIYYQTISELLRKSYTINQNGIGAVIRIIGGQSGLVEFPDIKPGLQMVLEDVLLQEQFQRTRVAFEDGQSQALNTFQNLSALTKMQKKNCFPFMKQQLLSYALNECLPKMLQILDVTLAKLVLRMDKDAVACASERLRAQENNNNNDVPDIYACKKQKTDFAFPPDEDGGEAIEVDDDAEKDANRMLLAHTIIDLLNTIEAGSKTHIMRTPEILKLSLLSVKYCFVCLTEKSATTRSTCTNRVFALMQRQCTARKAARTACLRELVEGALFYYGYLFGQWEDPKSDELAIPEHELVLMQNQRLNQGPNSNRTVLHAGVIGRGLRPQIALGTNSCDSELQTLLLRALNACCADTDRQSSIEGYSMISLLLVEMVSTDVMYNGLPFPEEEFSKVTMERDLLIRRAFLTSPILWAMLGFIATHRPALCFSSVLLRALCATCLHQWRAKNVNKFYPLDHSGELMQCTQRLLQILAMGQLLPPPLSNLHVIIEHFEAHEIALLLRECVWNYLKDHVPSPALFQADMNGLHWRNAAVSKIPPQYVDTLRNLMQKKLPRLGQHYHQMFSMAEMNSPQSELPSVAAPIDL